jgi:hypothetical protein
LLDLLVVGPRKATINEEAQVKKQTNRKKKRKRNRKEE